jgi:hypothetical protein
MTGSVPFLTGRINAAGSALVSYKSREKFDSAQSADFIGFIELNIALDPIGPETAVEWYLEDSE